MNRTYIKRRYFDMRTGMTTISPALALGNFLMLSYLTIAEIIPMWLFAPIFIVGIIGTYTLVGNKFRKVQTSTDINMNYEKSTEAVKSFYLLAKRINEMSDKIGMKRDPVFDQRLEYQKEISESRI